MKKTILLIIIYCISFSIYSQTFFLGESLTLNSDTLKCENLSDCLAFEIKDFLKKEGKPKYKEVSENGYYYYSKKGIVIQVSRYNRDSKNTSHFINIQFLFKGLIPNISKKIIHIKEPFRGNIHLEDIIINSSFTYKKAKESDLYHRTRKDLSMEKESDYWIILFVDYKNYALTLRFYKEASSQEHFIQSVEINIFNKN